MKNELLTLWVQIRDLYLYIFHKAIIVNGYVDDRTWWGVHHRNWGDELNYYLIKEITGRPVIFYQNFILAKILKLKNYMCIGTMLDANNCSNKQTIVWGAGVSGYERDFVTPKEILAIRGKKTKEFAERYGKTCPSIFGDPALLMPLIYQPSTNRQLPTTQRYKVGLIPHISDAKHPMTQEIKEKCPEDVRIIDLAHYEKWTDVIDEICSCDYILSSSLHGLVTADAYHIPNYWIRISGRAIIGNLKFHDYASSVERTFQTPAKIANFQDFINLYNHIDQVATVAEIEVVKEIQKNLIKVAPFKIKFHQS